MQVPLSCRAYHYTIGPTGTLYFYLFLLVSFAQSSSVFSTEHTRMSTSLCLSVVCCGCALMSYSGVVVGAVHCSGVVVEYQTHNRDVRVRLTPGPLQATLSKLLTYSVIRPTQPPTLSGTGNE